MYTLEAEEGKNSPRDRWKRATFFARRLGDGNTMLNKSQTGVHDTGAVQKHLETQHWLELVDA